MNSVCGDLRHTQVWAYLWFRAAWSFHLSRGYNPALSELRCGQDAQIELTCVRLVCLVKSFCQSLWCNAVGVQQTGDWWMMVSVLQTWNSFTRIISTKVGHKSRVFKVRPVGTAAQEGKLKQPYFISYNIKQDKTRPERHFSSVIILLLYFPNNKYSHCQEIPPLKLL